MSRLAKTNMFVNENWELQVLFAFASLVGLHSPEPGCDQSLARLDEHAETFFSFMFDLVVLKLSEPTQRLFAIARLQQVRNLSDK